MKWADNSIWSEALSGTHLDYCTSRFGSSPLVLLICEAVAVRKRRVLLQEGLEERSSAAELFLSLLALSAP